MSPADAGREDVAGEEPLSEADAERLHEARRRILDELGKIIVGQEAVIDEIMICLFSRGHVMLEGVPGLAKTLMISTLAKTLDLSFSRIQFTPDLMPADVTGTEIIEEDRSTGHRDFRFMQGPLFANVVLADEINRTPPKTQAALLEAMQERQVTVGRNRHVLPDPFFVLATQNPIEQEGTYPLPEAQQDRFMFKIYVEYPSFDEEFEVARRTTGTQSGRSRAGPWRRRDLAAAATGAAGAGQRPRRSLRLVTGPPNSRRQRGRPGLCGRSGWLGCRTAGGPILDLGWQGSSPLAGPFPRPDRGHSSVGPTGAAASNGGQLCGRE